MEIECGYCLLTDFMEIFKHGGCKFILTVILYAFSLLFNPGLESEWWYHGLVHSTVSILVYLSYGLDRYKQTRMGGCCTYFRKLVIPFKKDTTLKEVPEYNINDYL